MLQAMFSGVSGLQVHQTRLDVIGNNIANVNTIGFKSGSVTFEDQLSQTLKDASAPGANVGGVDPSQVGLGVMIGAVETQQTQGNLQTTGNNTDMAIQGNGFFMVSNGSSTSYTRDGSFQLDGNGVLVNPANGDQLLGYSADANGVVNTTQPITSSSVLKIPVGTLTSVKQTGAAVLAGNLDASSSLQTTFTTLNGNIANSPSTISTTAYDSQGNAHQVQFTFTQGAPTATDNIWNVGVTVDGAAVSGTHTMAFSLATGQYDPANSSGLPTNLAVNGTNGAGNFTMNVNYQNTLSDVATSPASAGATTDGQTGSLPTWSTSTDVYDSLGVKHNLTVTYTRAVIGSSTGTGTPPLAAPPSSATGQWNWTVKENGVTLASSTPGVVNPPATANETATNSPLYFGPNGNLLDPNKQTVMVTPVTGSTTPFPISLDFSGISQLAGTSNVAVTQQDGFPVGTLQSFNIDQTGLITGVFSNGQSRSLGQVAMATFTNAGALTKTGQNNYQASANSGVAQIGLPGAGGSGTINTGFLEMSNVDLSTEFTNLIVTQRGFQANTKIITTVDSMLNDVINMLP